MMTLRVLGSGSSGNAAILSTEGFHLLIDAGLSAKQIVLRLERFNLSLKQISGILLTHEHLDHTRGLNVLCKIQQTPVFCTPLTRESLRASAENVSSWKHIPSGGSFTIGPLQIDSFSVPHDAADPQGFVFEHQRAKLGLLSDTGHVNNLVRDKLRGLHALFVECNYDHHMLEADTRRPWATKQRISSRHGHLSNDQTVQLIYDIWHSDLKSVMLGHLSDDCNSPDLAVRVIQEALRSNGSTENIHVSCASRHDISPPLEVRAPLTPPPPTVRFDEASWSQVSFDLEI